MNGAAGAGAFVFTGVNVVGRAFGFAGAAFLRVFTKETSCQRCSSESMPQAGMPLAGEPVVMNQKTSPSGTVCVGPWASGGMLPVPCPLAPWHDAQYVA